MRTHLGDGVYAELEGDKRDRILLTDCKSGSEVYLSPEVWTKLLQWLAKECLPSRKTETPP